MQQIPGEAVAQQFAGFGATPDWASGFVDLYTSIGTPRYAGAPRSPASTTPTTLETYVADERSRDRNETEQAHGFRAG